jgi:hypothetical protein
MVDDGMSIMLDLTLYPRVFDPVSPRLGPFFARRTFSSHFSPSYRPEGPKGGEFDILEGVYLQTANQISVHISSSDCKQDPSTDVTGTAVEANTDCNANNNGSFLLDTPR